MASPDISVTPPSLLPWPLVWPQVSCAPKACLRPRQDARRSFDRFCQVQADRCLETAEAGWRRYVARVWAAQPNEGTRADWRIDSRW